MLSAISWFALPSTGSAQVYARIGEHVITVQEVEGAARLAGAENQADVVKVADELVTHALLAREAERRGYGRSEIVRARAQNTLVRELIRHAIDGTEDQRRIDAEDIDTRYVQPPRRWRRPLGEVRDEVRATLRRERRDAAIMRLIDDAAARSGYDSFPERLDAWQPPEARELTPTEALVQRYDCPHCRRQRQEDDSPMGPLPQPPAWARRRSR